MRRLPADENSFRPFITDLSIFFNFCPPHFYWGFCLCQETFKFGAFSEKIELSWSFVGVPGAPLPIILHLFLNAERGIVSWGRIALLTNSKLEADLRQIATEMNGRQSKRRTERIPKLGKVVYFSEGRRCFDLHGHHTYS